MPPRKTTDLGALFEALVEDLRVQIAASVDRTLSDFSRRIARLERRMDQLDPQHAAQQAGPSHRRTCSLCSRPAVARGLCSAHYQQWRYRQRRSKVTERNDTASAQSEPSERPRKVALPGPTTIMLTSAQHDYLGKN